MDILILAAGTIKNKIHFLKYTFDSPALIPINSESLAATVIKFYIHNFPKANIHLAVENKVYQTVERYISGFLKPINIIPIEESEGVNDTIKIVFNKVKPSDKIILNLVTTIPTEIPNLNEALIDNEISYSIDWSSIRQSESKINFQFKNNNKVNKGNAFTGVFHVESRTLEKALKKINKKKINDLLYLVKEINEIDTITFKKVEWIDCGHEMNYYRAKITQVSSRSFNKIQVNPIKGTLVKSSENGKKLKNEIDYIFNLPKELSMFFPRILRKPNPYQQKNEAEMEYYGYPSLAEYILFWDVNEGLWKNIFSALSEILEMFQSYVCLDLSIEDYLSFYWDKTERRVFEFKAQLGEAEYLFTNEIEINDVRCQNFDQLKNKIIAKLVSIPSASN